MEGEGTTLCKRDLILTENIGWRVSCVAKCVKAAAVPHFPTRVLSG